MELLEQELENLSKSVTSEQELQWNGHISALREDHNKVFNDTNAIVIDIKQDIETIGTLEVYAQAHAATNLFWMLCLGRLRLIFPL